jgi:cobalt-zinc-cadmium efflux system membrane fusion protein
VDRFSARVAVPEAAIVRTSRGPAVFRAAGSTFELQPVSPGRSDGEWTEIVAGLEAGARVVTRNAFLLKAELGKSEASHDH